RVRSRSPSCAAKSPRRRRNDQTSGAGLYPAGRFAIGLREGRLKTVPQDTILPHIIELELFRSLFVSIAEEMGAVLRKTSYSANIKERRDYSCAIYDASGQTVAMGDHMPVHLGAMPLSVQHALAAFRLTPGDVVILNDP